MQPVRSQTPGGDHPVAGSLDVHRGADQGEVSERLRIVAEVLAGTGVGLLREQSHRRGEGEEAR